MQSTKNELISADLPTAIILIVFTFGWHLKNRQTQIYADSRTFLLCLSSLCVIMIISSNNIPSYEFWFGLVLKFFHVFVIAHAYLNDYRIQKVSSARKITENVQLFI